MADEYEDGMAPGSDDAAHDDDLSPSLDNDTQDGASGSDSAAGTDEMATLRAELEDMKRRVANGSRTTQELRQAQQALQQYEQRLNRWKTSGVDPDEIDRILDSSGQGNAQSQAAANSDTLTKAELDKYLQQRDMLRDWNYEKKIFFKEHPDFDNKFFRRHMDSIAAELANDEINEYGRIVSSPEEVASRAGKELKAMMAEMETKALKKHTTQREKVKSQGITETTHQKGKKEEDTPMSEKEYLEYSRRQQADLHRQHQQRFLGRA